jgi:hypothetical protein
MFNETYLEFDCSPTNEAGVQVSKTDDYLPAMREEAKRMIDLLEKKFPDAPGYFCIKRQSHDFGTYLEIRYVFDEEEDGWDYTNHIENNWPKTWNDDVVVPLN